jgi:phosphoribosyl 1,2-cyclic phosphodiesterase
MRITFHGVRGSIPTPGPSTARYGGNTVCVEVRTLDGTLIVLDAGTGIRELGKKLVTEDFKDIIHLLITHRHWDHVHGLPFFAPAYRKDTRIMFHPVTHTGWEAAQHPVLFDGVHFPVRFEDLPAKMDVADVPEGPLQVGSAKISYIKLNHPGGATGFRIDDEDGQSVCYLTDNELNPPYPITTSAKELAKFAEGTGLMIHDAQYLPTDMPMKRGWGHSLVHEVLALAHDAGVSTVALHHHEPERDDEALDRIAKDSEAWARENATGMRVIVSREGLVFP